MDLQLVGRTALVTGSTSGIGAGIAGALAREGATVVVHGRSEARASAVVEEIRGAGGTAYYALGDLSTDKGANSVIEYSLATAGQIDILVNNVGGPVEGKAAFFDTTLPEWVESFNSNALAAIRMIHGLVPAMRSRGWGRVIQISSRNGISPHANMPSYGASKAAMNNFTLCLSKELAFSGVTSNAIMPGLIYTQQLSHFLQDIAQRQGWGDDIEKAKEHVLKNVVRQTVSRLGMPNDIANYVCYIASPLSDFLTGTVVRIDGGSTPTL
ncbi:SDR family NAD(P)-dependent oxidoreductase [Paraburkholderia terrae]|uniref:SDR family oxidoreductase n=1 Tax=Paraburkholderia terrae TaxID=311230 RepID=A0A2I8F4M5_9BURK|nr:SDR family NAD(P)-dependent oxidoreductase [Paraburkholderia terrae]AUT66679.1 SDR family oxidoreductase [Paraburkholderia terrae]